MDTKTQFETLVETYYEPLFRFALNLTRTESDASDLTQQTFYAWAVKGHQLRDITKVRTWLFTTLRNAFLKDCRKRQGFAFEELETVVAQIPAPDLQPGIQGDCSEVLSALEKVDPVYRSAVSLFYLSDYKYAEIVSILGIPLGTVKSRVARGVMQLREILISKKRDFARVNDVRCSCLAAHSIVPPAREACPTPCRAEEVLIPFDRIYTEGDLSSTLLPGTILREWDHIPVTVAC